MDLKFFPLTPDRWKDLVQLFGERGACGGCWCMWWRQTRSEFARLKGSANERAFQKIVGSGVEPGVLAYAGGQPIAWCAVAPRESFPTLERSRTLKRVDDEPVWSVTCLFVTRPWRRKAVTPRLLQAALRFAGSRGAKIVEGYPVEPRGGRMPDAFAWTGLLSAFLRAGFKEVARRSPTRPIVRAATSPRVSRRRG